MKSLVLLATLALGGCAEGSLIPGVTVRTCEECYYTNTTNTYQSLYLPDGKVVPILPGQRIDLDALGIRNYTVKQYAPKLWRKN